MKVRGFILGLSLLLSFSAFFQSFAEKPNGAKDQQKPIQPTPQQVPVPVEARNTDESSALSFGGEMSPEDLVTWYELEEMAAGQNQIVLPDCSLAGIRDDLARWIPASGLEITLTPPRAQRVFLYIDFVGFFDRRYETAAREKACLPARREAHFDGDQGGPYGYVEVFINGRRRVILYRGSNAGFTGPIAIPISRDEFYMGKVRIRLLPSNRSFAVWDMFLSHSPPE